jgi:hypothetical protein
LDPRKIRQFDRLEGLTAPLRIFIERNAFPTRIIKNPLSRESASGMAGSQP